MMRSHVIQLTILLDLSGSMTAASDRNTGSADLATIFSRACCAPA